MIFSYFNYLLYINSSFTLNCKVAVARNKDWISPVLADCHPKRPPVPYYPASVSHIIRPAINHYSTVLLT